MAGTSQADVRGNRARLLAAARGAFATDGTEASLHDVARRAGVGIGTPYRHFPTREDALLTWLNDLAAGTRTLSGATAIDHGGTGEESSELHVSCAARRASGARLLERAQVRADVTVHEVIALAIGLARAAQ
ncbi:SbtR family transcriptional regulator [Nonomuraea guangzhouensis]|uniref:TetR family transcriptional regulator n=1 Tax=Nonomuraea guangzhouensis TaxID=1291555 RepID=A0ABW4GNG2_9ACTN|nr:TetR family transcriptional regulator [Nonomuraea guangzhouensis]